MPIPSLTSSVKSRVPAARTKEANTLSKHSRDPPPEGPARNGTAVTRSLTVSSRPVSSYSSDVDGIKRRSFLPQPGDLKHGISRAPQGQTARDVKPDKDTQLSPVPDVTPSNAPALSRDVERTVEASPARSRAQSMFVASSRGSDAHQDLDTAPTARIQRSSGVVNKPTSTQQTALSRTQSIRKPTGQGQAPQSSTARSHLRTQSVTTKTGPQDTSVETKARRERPRSLFVPQTSSSKVSTQEPSDATTSGTSKSARSVTLSRSASVRTRQQSTSSKEPVSLAARARAAPAHRVTSTVTGSKDTSREEPKNQARPAFSTLQQHYTPRKVGKAPTSTFLHPSAPDVSSDTITPEVASIQAELLQLHLLHQAAAPTSKQWELSAMKSLQRQFNHTTRLYRIMRDAELGNEEQKNIRALKDWSTAQPNGSLAEYIQIISSPLQELPSLVETDGRFGRLVEAFEQWARWVEEVSAARSMAVEAGRPCLQSIEALGDSWKAENAALTRKLTSYSRDLGRLPQPTVGSSIATIVTLCQQLVDSLLEELQVMRKIEQDTVAREQKWVEAGLKAIARDVGSLLDSDQDCGAWRT